MPPSPIISVKNIGKKYKLGATLGGRNYKTLRDVLTKAAFNPFRKLPAEINRCDPFLLVGLSELRRQLRGMMIS